jgi:sulfate adenylyltransferase subunit 2
MNHLDALENQSIFIIREAYNRLKPIAMLWSLGKDSGVMIHLARKAFFGHMPFPVMHLDTGAEFPETYAFREHFTRAWGLNLIADPCPPLEEVDSTLLPASRFAARKTLGLKKAIEDYKLAGVFVGIRRDEQATRAKERIFSPRLPGGEWDFKEQPPEFWDQFNTDCPPGAHVRVHPLLAWTELDVWLYTKRENIPVVPLYFSRDGKRYRSLGEKGITNPIESTASSIDEIIAELRLTRTEERAGRAMDHEAENAFERLRSAGYM